MTIFICAFLLYNFLEFLEEVRVGICYVVTYVLYSYKKIHDVIIVLYLYTGMNTSL